ncbi:MAG: DEAD/DEAH box helicase, partial [Lentisphaerae bacterium]|nr:DEAD/DEAH box helicase [Lentisphaerota bacterium]
LGKTVQLLAHLLAEKQNGRLKSPCLIVAPTSVLQSWRQEISKFTPKLTVLEAIGPDRQPLLADAGRADLILTSYGLVRNDVAHYAKLKLSHVVLDEAQFIKNAASQTARAVCCLNSPRRFCLTGTPIQNHLGELWSLFQFLMPGFLGSEQEFQRRFRTPIEDGQSPERRAILARRLAPFILRRTKEEVAKELPPRTEIVQTVSLSPRQGELYEAIRLAMESRVQEEIRGRGLARSQIVVLAALLKLRQLCCDPRLTHPEEKLSIPEDSCKLEALLELLPEMIEEGRKILLFSQFTTMLALIETALKEIAIPYVILTGSTKDRTEPVRRFQAGEVPLFLISLKAGGFGLNLTAADTVIHYDPWWNPAAEAQASDRAHRIGQDKPVFIYKLVAEGTVEAKILAMQEKKRDLVAGLLSEQPGHEMKLDAATLQDLFSPLT